MFRKQKFGSYVTDGSRIHCRVGKFDCYAFTERDDCRDKPDERDCGFWPSQNPNDAGYRGKVSPARFRRLYAKAESIMQAWLKDEWDYCGVIVQVECNGVKLTEPYLHALWGVERNYPLGKRTNTYLTQVANELLPEALEAARAKIDSLCDCEES
jgi:hypothetical protein